MQTLKLQRTIMTLGTRVAAVVAGLGAILNVYYYSEGHDQRLLVAGVLTIITAFLAFVAWMTSKPSVDKRWIDVGAYTLSAIGLFYTPFSATFGGGFSVAMAIMIFASTILAYGKSIRWAYGVAFVSTIAAFIGAEVFRPSVYPDEIHNHFQSLAYILVAWGTFYVIGLMAKTTTEQSRLLSRAMDVGKIGMVTRPVKDDTMTLDDRAQAILETDSVMRMVPLLQQMDEESYQQFMMGCATTDTFNGKICWKGNKFVEVERFVDHNTSVWLLRDITEYEKALDEAKEKSERIEQIAQATNVAMWRAEWDTHEILEANDRFYEMVGMTREEYAEKNTLETFLSFHSDDDQKDIIQKRKSSDVTELDGTSYLDTRMLFAADGTKRFVKAYVTIKILDNGLKVIDGAFVDITENEELTREHRQSLMQLQMTAEAGKIGLFRHNLDTDSMEVNDYYREMREIPKHVHPLTLEIATKNVVSDADNRVSYYDVLKMARTDSEPSVFNAIYTSPKDGHKVYQRLVAKPVFNIHGKLIAMTGAVFDVTEEKEAQLAAEYALQQLSDATTAGKIGLFTHNLATDRIEMNDVLREMTDFPESEFPYITPEDLMSRIPEERRIYVLQDMKKVQEQQKTEASWEITDRFGKNRKHLDMNVRAITHGGIVHSVSGAVFDVTERHEMVQELKRNQYRVDILNKAGKIGIFDVNLKTMKVHVTDEILLRAGLPLDEHNIDVLPFHDMIPDDSREEFEQHVKNMMHLEIGEVYRYSHPQNTNRGRLQIETVATKIVVGGEEHVIGTATDITEQHIARTKLEESNKFIEQLVDAAKIGIFRSRQDTREFTYVNNYYREIMDLPEEDYPTVRAEDHFSRLAESDRVKVITRRDRGEEEFLVPIIETRQIETPDGRDKWVRSSVVVNAPTNETPYNTVSGAFIDVTDQMLQAAKISEQLAQMDLLADFGNVAVFEVDLNTMRVKGNKTLFTREGITDKDDISTIRLWKDVTPETADLIDETLERMKTSGEGYQVNIEYETSRPSDDTHKTYRLVGRKAYKNNRPVMLGVSIDTTDHTRLIGQLKLANQSKDAFLSQISHEIRTPLNGIYGALQMLSSDSNMSKEERFYVNTALSSYKDIITIVNDILDSSRIARGTLTFNNKPTFLMPVIQEAFNEFKQAALNKGITYKLNGGYSNEYDVRIMDEVRVKQIIRNLLSNAMKNTVDGSVILGVDIDDDYVILTVTDTGIGIKPEDQERIFERFEQTGTEQEMGMGTGLGLSIVTYLVREMNGSVSVSSIYGEGSTFRVRIRLERSSPIQAKILNNDDFEMPKDPAELKVLLVDDVRTNLMILEAFVKKEVTHVDTVMSGEQALSKIKEMGYDYYDIVFMDIKMPGMGGLEAARRLQENGFHTPIIASTANVMKSDIDTYLRTGFASVLGKPYERAEVSRILKTYCY